MDAIHDSRSLEYISDDEAFLIRLPECPEDVVAEGNNLHHCVASYVDRIKNRDTTILFVRKKEAPDESYFTMEVKNDCVLQLRGYCNTTSYSRELRDFIRHWAKTKKIDTRYIV